MPSPVPTYSNLTEIDIETGVVLWSDDMPYDGPWGEAKKGREATAQATEQSLEQGRVNAQRQGEQYSALQPEINQLTAVGANGLGLGANGMLANSLENIGRTYANARQGVARSNAQRGFGGTPDAAFASGINSANIQQAGDENSAYNNAQMLTRENMLAGINARQGLYTGSNPTPANSTAIQGGVAQNNEGSTLGDIGKGVSAVAGLATGVAGLPNAFKSGGWTS